MSHSNTVPARWLTSPNLVCYLLSDGIFSLQNASHVPLPRFKILTLTFLPSSISSPESTKISFHIFLYSVFRATASSYSACHSSSGTAPRSLAAPVVASCRDGRSQGFSDSCGGRSKRQPSHPVCRRRRNRHAPWQDESTSFVGYTQEFPRLYVNQISVQKPFGQSW
jgi:hypothetical protein